MSQYDYNEYCELNSSSFFVERRVDVVLEVDTLWHVHFIARFDQLELLALWSLCVSVCVEQSRG